MRPDPAVHHLSLPQAHRVAEVAAPGQRVLAVTQAPFSFTNSVHFLDTASAAGNVLWDGDRISAVLDWDSAACGDPTRPGAVDSGVATQMGDLGATDDRAATDYYEFVAGAIRRARDGRWVSSTDEPGLEAAADAGVRTPPR